MIHHRLAWIDRSFDNLSIMISLSYDRVNVGLKTKNGCYVCIGCRRLDIRVN